MPELLRWAFVGPEGVRSGWRALAFAVATGATTLLVLLPVAVVLGVVRGDGDLPLPLELGAQSLAELPVFLVMIGLGALLDRGGPWVVGLGAPVLRATVDALLGVVLGGLLVVAAWGVLVAAGTAAPELVQVSVGVLADPSALVQVPGWVLFFTIAAAWEEAVFRGYGFVWATRGLGLLGLALTTALGADRERWFAAHQHGARVVTVGVGSTVFGLAHLFNPAHTGIATVNTALAGVWFAVALFRSRALWLPIGMHLGWNLAQGFLIGSPISGFGGPKSDLVFPSLLTTTLAGPEWLTGGAYGLEGSVLGTGGMLLGLGLAAVWPRRRRWGMPGLHLGPLTIPGRAEPGAVE